MTPDRPVDNAPYLSHTHAGLTVEGYSRAAVQSYWRVPELKVGFDLGAQPWDFMGTPAWFGPHTHLAPSAAPPVYGRRPELLAGAGTESRVRPRCPAVGLHGHPDVVRLAHPPRPHRGAAGVRRPPADDEDGAADRLRSGRVRGGRPAVAANLSPPRP